MSPACRSGLIVASMRQATSNRSSVCFLWAFLTAAGAVAGGASPRGSSRTYHFLSCLSTIIRLRSQSRKLAPVSLSFSRMERRDRLLVFVTVLAIYTFKDLVLVTVNRLPISINKPLNDKYWARILISY